MSQKGVTDDSLKDFGADRKEGNAAVIIGVPLITFLVDGDDVSVFPDARKSALIDG